MHTLHHLWLSPFCRKVRVAMAEKKQEFDLSIEKVWENREAFLADEEAFMEKYGLNDQQKEAIRKRDVLGLIEAGGNIYYLAKFAGIFKLSVQDVGGLQTGKTTEEFKEFLASQA